ncbi:alanine:cation symporter family protein [Flavobacterium agricola]|uniref:Alanine:cation symporter family protein n=1 Tax=Flavobacterium agricola TaxID=2870839 RepID=A0ABY6M1W5_9FLAO|nr:alanine/glycine:cation symporter family protein [Flavobacterium agricola]UYW02504.1 alanine:cation symporter family protein [Flavobacterium agricola]
MNTSSVSGFSQFVDFLNAIIWSDVFIVLCIGTGLYFSFVTKFLQVRYLKDMVKLLFTEGSNDKGVSPFQAFSIAIAGRVGTGNIAGVATAIAMGGPGAVFWMWMIAFLGASTAFIEATLGQIYKVNVEGEYRGGPAYYIEKGLDKKWFAWIFAIVTIVGCLLFLPGVQSNSIADGLYNAFHIEHLNTGVLVAGLLALVVFGGAKRIGRVSEIVVPFMAGAYILMAVVIIVLNIGDVPKVFKLIISSALSFDATFGAIVGSAISWGVKRGIYSNEAGQGTAPHAAAAAATTHPVKQGLVQSFSVYIDTLFVCSATAFIILFTQKYNVVDSVNSTESDSTYLVEYLPGVQAGAAYTQHAVSVYFPTIGSEFIAIALFLFAFTTAMAYYFIAESNYYYLSKYKKNVYLLWTMRFAFLASVIYGAVSDGGSAWKIGDIGVGVMAWLNIIAILLLRKPALIALKDYQEQRSQGINPVFNPEKLGIKNTTEWQEDDKK